ncbi:MFS transporter [Mycobacterium sp. MUNTM1]
MLLTSLDVTIVNVALPTIRNNLAVEAHSLGWMVVGYTIPFATLMLSGGAITDRVGPERAFLLGIMIFGLGSLGCAAAGNLTTLVAARVSQGIGAAICTPSALAVLRSNVPASQLGRAVAYWAFSGAIAISAGPLLGGVLIEAFGWRSIFLLNLPIVITAAMLTLPQARRPSAMKNTGRTDTLGQLIYAGSSIVVVAGTNLLQHDRGSTVSIVAPAVAVAAVCGFALFYVVEARASNPVLPPALFRSRVFQSAVIVGASVNAVNFGLLYCLGLFYGGNHGLSALHSGLLFLPMMLATGVSTTVVEPIRSMVGDHITVVAGLLLELMGAVLIAAGTDTVVWVSIWTVPMGFGVGLVIPPITTRLLNSVDPAESGTASGAFSSLRQLGSAVGVAAFGLGVRESGTSLHVDIRSISATCTGLIAISVLTYLITARSATNDRSTSRS